MSEQQKQQRRVVITREEIREEGGENAPPSLDEISGALAHHIRQYDELGDAKRVEDLAHIRDQLSVFRAGGGGGIR